MIITAEIKVNPGENALFVAEVKVEKNSNVTPNWWGLWLAWWLYPMRRWREWLWGWEVVCEGGWFTWHASLLGFEINWQKRRW
jgi:hypothetical protein